MFPLHCDIPFVMINPDYTLRQMHYAHTDAGDEVRHAVVPD